jgi:hypothetical protein
LLFLLFLLFLLWSYRTSYLLLLLHTMGGAEGGKGGRAEGESIYYNIENNKNFQIQIQTNTILLRKTLSTYLLIYFLGPPAGLDITIWSTFKTVRAASTARRRALTLVAYRS